jgi:hypothetical protein
MRHLMAVSSTDRWQMVKQAAATAYDSVTLPER